MLDLGARFALRETPKNDTEKKRKLFSRPYCRHPASVLWAPLGLHSKLAFRHQQQPEWDHSHFIQRYPQRAGNTSCGEQKEKLKIKLKIWKALDFSLAEFPENAWAWSSEMWIGCVRWLSIFLTVWIWPPTSSAQISASVRILYFSNFLIFLCQKWRLVRTAHDSPFYDPSIRAFFLRGLCFKYYCWNFKGTCVLIRKVVHLIPFS